MHRSYTLKGRNCCFDCISVVKLHNVVQFGSPIFLYSGSLETQYWRGFARVGCAQFKMFALLDCSELPLRPEPGRPWTTSPSPWTAGTACGCTLAAHRLGRVAHRLPAWGGTPPQTPPRLRGPAGPFEKLNPGGEEGLGVQRGQPQAVDHPGHRAHPCPEPPPAG